jgi:general secretion pathway protein J
MTAPRSSGFTLIEVMIAVAVLAMIGAVTWKSFDSANDLKLRVERAEERDQAGRASLARIAREVSMTFLSEHYDHKRFRQRPTFFKLRDGRGDAQLMITSFAHERLHTDAKESDESVFEYRLDRGDDGKISLFRRVKALIDEEPDRGGERAVLADDVLKFSVEAWDPKDREWRPEWDSNSPQRSGGALVPPRVRVSLTMKDDQGRERTWTTQAGLSLTQPLDF